MEGDRRFLIFVLIFGLAASWGCYQWIRDGEIALRGGSPRGVAAVPRVKPLVRLTNDHPLYYPVIAGWVLLAATMVLVSIVGLINGNEQLMKVGAYACATLLGMGFATVAIAYLFGSA